MTRRSFLFPLHGRRTIVGRMKTTSFFLPLALSVLPYTSCSMLDQGVWAEVSAFPMRTGLEPSYPVR